jgi:MFS family permease
MTTVTATAAGPPATGSRLSGRRSLLILLLLCGAQFLVVLDATIVNVALPSIQRALHFTEQDLQWVASGYALTFAGFLLLGGRAADLLGRRRIFMAGVLLFIAASFTGGLATSSGMLLGARFVQGLGGAMLSPAALSLLTTSFAGVAAGLVNTMQRVGSSVGLAVLTAVATARTRALATPGHQVAAEVGGYDRAFLIAAAFAAAASLVSLATARARRAAAPTVPSTPVPAAPAR